ncbi:hypothetical protein ACFYUR_22145 [Micromonospora haikouensis]|uniref:hypothetical protein n=1 Tax=Micromonospora haikouensis TaxID=686309 RepID=UPI0036B9C97A
MRKAASSLRRRVGHRGSALLFFAVLDLVYCHSLLLPSPQARRGELLTFLASMLPLWTWAAAWGAVGALCLVQAFRSRDQAAFAAAIGLKVLWGVVTLGGWVIAGLDRGYVTASVWLVFAAFVGIVASWPEPPHGWKERTWTPPSA